MLNIDLYNKISLRLSKDITKSYSSSFSSATALLNDEVSQAIYAIYGFVRVADEIVDTWRPKGMEMYINELSNDYKRAVKNGFSVNPIVQSFALTIKKYDIPIDLVESFLKSMKMDIKKKTYSAEEYKSYIYGSAEVVGLMCLMVFVNGNKKKYNSLLPAAKALGSAFQKVNFLRDINSDSSQLGRLYFPSKNIRYFDDNDKLEIVDDIKKDLKIAKPALKKLPKSSRYGVELAYRYFSSLNKKIAKTPAKELLSNRVGLNKKQKLAIYSSIRIRQKLAS